MKNLSLSLIAQTVAARYDVTMAQLRGPSRPQHLCEARSICFYLARKYLGQSSGVIAAWFGDRDHTGVLRGAKRAQERIKIDAAFAAFVRGFETALNMLSRTKFLEGFEQPDALKLAQRLLSTPRAALSASADEIEALALRIMHDDTALSAAAQLVDALADPTRAFNDNILGDLAGALAAPLEALGYLSTGEQAHG